MLVLSIELRRRIAGWAVDADPHEACGLLIGRGGDSFREVVEVRACRNLNRERSRDRYELDPADLLAADRDARAAGLDVIGVWHSHPKRPARPSETDRAAAWPGWSYLIVAVQNGRPAELRSWRLALDEFVEEDLRPVLAPADARRFVAFVELEERGSRVL